MHGFCLHQLWRTGQGNKEVLHIKKIFSLPQEKCFNSLIKRNQRFWLTDNQTKIVNEESLLINFFIVILQDGIMIDILIELVKLPLKATL